MTKKLLETSEPDVVTPTIDRKPRKQAPDVQILDEYYKDERKWRNEQAREMLGEKARGMHFCYHSAQTDPKQLKREGYVPVIIDGEQISHKMHLLYMCSAKKRYRDREAPAAESRAQCQEALEGTNEKYVTRDAEGLTHGLIKE